METLIKEAAEETASPPELAAAAVEVGEIENAMERPGYDAIFCIATICRCPKTAGPRRPTIPASALIAEA